MHKGRSGVAYLLVLYESQTLAWYHIEEVEDAVKEIREKAKRMTASFDVFYGPTHDADHPDFAKAQATCDKIHDEVSCTVMKAKRLVLATQKHARKVRGSHPKLIQR